MLQDNSPSNSTANWPTRVIRPRFITPINLVGLVVAVGVTLVLLYPQKRLSEQFRTNLKIDAVSLQYMRNLLATEPENYQLRLDLARDYTTLGQYTPALNILQPLYMNIHPAWREAAYLTQLDILTKITCASLPGSPDHDTNLARLRQALRNSESRILSTNGLLQLANVAEFAGDSALAERSLTRFMRHNHNPTDLEIAARIALTHGHYLSSAQYIWRARALASNPEQKIKYLKLALATLQSGGFSNIGLEWVRQLPSNEWQRSDVCYLLTKFALAANQPAAADNFATQLIGLNKFPARPISFNSTWFDLAYTAFLGNNDLPHALALAQIAVDQASSIPIWHERLAKVAEWSGQPQLALKQWRWLATYQGNESAWQAWMRLAGGLFDYAAQVIGLEHDWQRHSNDDNYAHKIVQLYEYLGQPENALTWLDKHGDGLHHPDLLLLSAELLTRMGRDAEAISRYRQYISQNAVAPDLAVTIAALMLRADLRQEAFAILEQSQPQAKPEDQLFWLNLGELAWQLQHYDQAIIAYRMLSNAPDAQPFQQQRLFQALKHTNPQLAAQTAEQYWQKTVRIDLFLDAVSTYAELNDWTAVQHLYKITDAPKWHHYDSNFQFIALRAEMYKHEGNFTAAEHDDLLLIKRNPSNSSIKESFLWLLLDSRQFSQLDQFVRQWAKLIPYTPILWDAYAAAQLALGRPDDALALYNLMAKTHARDELWLLNYATTLESSGQPELAWQIRRQIWQQHLNQWNKRDWLTSRTNARDIEALRLFLLNDPALGQGILWKLLRDGSPALKQNSQFVELATVWLNDRGQDDATRAWLIHQYAHWLNTPLAARISDALARQNREDANEILNHDGIPLYDKMNLSHLAEHNNEAADLAFIAMDRSRINESLYVQVSPMLLLNDQTVGAMTTFRNLYDYRETENDISTTGQQIGGLKLDLGLYQISRYGVDTMLLNYAPNEIGSKIALHQIGNNYVNTIKLQFSQAINTQTSVSFIHQQQANSRLLINAELNYNQAADEDPLMQLIGRRNQIALQGNYRLDNWNEWETRGELNQYHSIDQQNMGNGTLLSTSLTHHLSEVHPALQGVLTGTWSTFQPTNTLLTGKTASLIPYGQPNNASYFMPQNIHEIAAYARMGDATDSNLPAHDFEYMGEIGRYYDTVYGGGWRINAGLAGRVIGADRLQAFIRYDQGAYLQGASEQYVPTLEVGIAYLLHY